MRYPGKHKQATRKRVLKEAASAIREKGPDGVAVTEIMARAGLTHGGFYAHFASKSELVCQAMTMMFDEERDRVANASEAADARTALHKVISSYLSPKHRDDAAGGCPMPALLTDVARLTGPARSCFTTGVSDMAAKMAATLESLGIENAESQSRALQAQMVGAVSLARAVDSPTLSDAILRDTYARIVRELDLAQQ